MVDLSPTSPVAGLLPVSHGTARLSEVTHASILSIAPYDGAEAAVSKALEAAIGARLPAVGRSVEGVKCEVLWTGRGQYFVLGRALPHLDAAVTDQSDAWACVALDGAEAEAVMARLCPLDLRALKEGHVARSLIGHMQAIIIRRANGYELMVFRSMAQTLVHEVARIMRSVAAQSTKEGGVF